MAKVELDADTEPTPEELSMSAPAVGSLLMSVAFWLALLMSASMYAAVSLSPKLADWMNVRQQHAENAFRLTQLEDEADYLERVAAALKSDPEFARHLVRAEISPQTEDSELMPVAPDLLFGESARPFQKPPQIVRPEVATVVLHLARHQRHRTWLLAGAAGLTLLAFTLLNDAGAGIAMSAIFAVRAAIRAAVSRYRAELPPGQEETEDPN